MLIKDQIWNDWMRKINFILISFSFRMFKLFFKTRIKIKNLSVWKLISPFLVGFQFLKIMIHLHSHPYSPCQKLTPRTGKGWNQWNNQFTKQTIIWPCGSPSIHVPALPRVCSYHHGSGPVDEVLDSGFWGF